MRGPFRALALLLAFAPISFAQDFGSHIQSFEHMPTCAMECVAALYSAGGLKCDLDDHACICADQELQSTAEECVRASCPLKNALTVKNMTMTICNGPIRDITPTFRIPNIALQVVSGLCVALRIGYKLIYTIDTIRLDDYLIVASFFLLVPATFINDLGTMANGHGRDIWTLTYDQIKNFLKWFYVVEILYLANIALLKLSLLAFFHYIFPGPKIRRVILATAIFDILFGVSFVLAGTFQCRPISSYWERWDEGHAGRCININALGWSNAAINIVLDAWMLIIPLSQVKNLQLPWKKKIGVAMMFCVGTFVTIISIIRLESLVHFANTTNPTYDQLPVSNWSTIEINVGIICACMPAIRVVLVRMFPRVFGNSSRDYASNKYASGMPSGGPKSRPSKHGFDPQRSIITYTKTFEVQHTQKSSDEVGLVAMQDLRRSSFGQVRSGNASQVSV